MFFIIYPPPSSLWCPSLSVPYPSSSSLSPPVTNGTQDLPSSPFSVEAPPSSHLFTFIDPFLANHLQPSLTHSDHRLATSTSFPSPTQTLSRHCHNPPSNLPLKHPPPNPSALFASYSDLNPHILHRHRPIIEPLLAPSKPDPLPSPSTIISKQQLIVGFIIALTHNIPDPFTLPHLSSSSLTIPLFRC